ncbi:hypothetical protein AAG570_003005 [Ranatra chinensis]|uniref:Non-structural maintenance of chromosomes element 1 homolog n=1 Tax=Ranatra chinensis TaxID=642074 RepID=A0ABD0YS89_9HEMI
MSVGASYKLEFRSLLQTIMFRKIIPFKLLQDLHNRHPGDNSDLDDVICKMNETLNTLHQRIKICHCELTGEKLCVFVSTVEREYQKKYKIFDGPQEEYFLLIVNHIICSSEDGYIGSVDALNLSSKITTPVTGSVAEHYLQLYVKKGYLLVPSIGKYCLSMLAITELEPYFTQFEDYLKHCFVCKRAGFIGLKCNNCEKFIHKHCHSNFNQFKPGSKPICPSCKQELPFLDQ